MAERNQKIDFYKGILIFCVLFGHSVSALKQNDTDIFLHVFVRTFDMPFFIFLSGYMLKKTIDRYDWYKYLLNKCSGILFPTLFWGGMFSIGTLYVAGNLQIKTLAGSMLSCFWFLWATLFCSGVIIVLHGIFRKKSIEIAVAVLITCVLHTVPNIGWNLAFMFPFFGIGFYVPELQQKVSPTAKKRIQTAAFIAFTIAICFWSTKYNVWNGGTDLRENTSAVLKAVLFRGTIGIVGIITMEWVFEILCRLLKDSFLKKKLLSFGQNTMMIYIFQSIFLEYAFGLIWGKLIASMGGNVLAENTLLLQLIAAPLLAFIYLYLLDLIISRMKKIKYIKMLTGFRILDARRR